MSNTEHVKVHDRWNYRVQFTAEVTCEHNASEAFKLGLAVAWAYKNGVDVSDTALYGAVLRGTYLSGVFLRDANLSGADLSKAVVRDPVVRDAPKIKNIHQAVFAAASKSGELVLSTWREYDADHAETTYLLESLVISLAGEKGRILQNKIGSEAAASLIYRASDPTLETIPDFYRDDTVVRSYVRSLAQGGAA